jgi:hypothetical protein
MVGGVVIPIQQEGAQDKAFSRVWTMHFGNVSRPKALPIIKHKVNDIMNLNVRWNTRRRMIVKSIVGAYTSKYA